jgi:hypothetical protein
LEQVLEEQPANGLAEEYLAKAKDLPEPAPKDDAGSFPWLLVAGGAGGVVVLGGLAAAVLASRKRRGPVPSHAGLPVQPARPVGPAAEQLTEQVTEQVTERLGEQVDERVPVPAGFATAAPVTTEPVAQVGFAAPVSSPVSTPASTAVAASGRTVADVARRFCTGCGHEADGAYCARCGTKVAQDL